MVLFSFARYYARFWLHPFDFLPSLVFQISAVRREELVFISNRHFTDFLSSDGSLPDVRSGLRASPSPVNFLSDVRASSKAPVSGGIRPPLSSPCRSGY